ncbi:TonB-dependent receptor [Sunxiuqinia sp. A32]|uniref:TonB-dependent receptor n=1 Tax=Sunxiuqinia sp. A32 TaxID=3461496 RepID=UPI0040455F01
MKKNPERWVLSRHALEKSLQLMKWTLFLFFVGIIQVFANNTYSQQTKFSMSFERTKLEDVLNEIENQSEYYFLYNQDDINVDQSVNIKVKDEKIDDLLMQLFESTDINFSIYNRQIVLTNRGTKDFQFNNQTTNSVTGKVFDSSGLALPGATIVVKGTTNGTITDFDGNYSLPNVAPDAILVFSFVGMRTQEVPVDGKATIDITLAEDAIGIEEVVAIGYGTQKRGSITGSIASINSKELTSVKTANVSNTLAGKLPGLRAVQRSGAPGDDAAILDIRGFGSPLVIVDGIERDFRQVDANDIESISILKDASAAVYGFKGANGVILVTTKKGATSKPKINYTSYYGLQQVTRYPEMMDGYEYATIYNEAQTNVGVNPAYSEDELANFKAGIGTTDWLNETIRKSVPQMYHHVGVSGGTEKVKYFFSFGLTDQHGIYVSDDFNYKKYNVRSNISAEITSGLTVDLQLSGLLDQRTKPYESESLFRRIQGAIPIYPIFANEEKGYWQAPGVGGNPLHLSTIDAAGYDNRDRREFSGTVIFNWEIPWVKGLSAKALLGYDYKNEYTKKWYKAYNEYNYNTSTDQYEVYSSHANLSELSLYSQNYFKPIQQYSLNYSNDFGKHNVGALLLWELYNDRWDWFDAYRQFTVSAIDQLNAGEVINMDNGGSAGETAHEGLVGRINYAYANKYLAEVSFRYDGSYKFDDEKRWGFFPAVSLGWRMSEESFFKDALPFVENLKIRGSYGKVGDEGDFSAFQYLSGYKYPSGSYVLGTGGLSNGAVEKGMPNKALTWYESTTANIGFEASAWQGLLSAEFDCFIRNRDGLLATRLLTLPSTFGQSLPQENLNSDKTRGFEIVLGHRNKIKEFTYSVKANFSTTREIFDYVERAAPTNMYDNWRNNNNGRFKAISWGKVALGQFESFADILNSPIQDNNGNKSLLPGDIKYKDVNNDGIIDGKDDQIIGYGVYPRMYYGIDLSGQYKGFDLSLFLQGGAGHDVFVGGDFLDPLIQQGLGNGLAIWMDRWHREDPTDPASAWVPGTMPAIRPTGFEGNRGQSTWTLHKADYLRLKSIEVGYTLPSSLLQKAGIETLRIYLNSLNPLTFTSNEGLMKYMDPENRDSALRYYPQMKTFNVGVNLTF